MGPPKDEEILFRGGSTVMRPNHMTRFIYPSLCDTPREMLRLQPPIDPLSRTRPQGSGMWGKDGTTFISLTRAVKPSPTPAEFKVWILAESQKDYQSANPLGRAMQRISGFQGNTVLESGKFMSWSGQMLYFVIKRTTSLAIKGGGFETDICQYQINVDDWHNLKPKSSDEGEHDSWWMRLHTLFQGKMDRAYFHAQEQMDRLGVYPQVVHWRPRPDVENHAEIYNKGPLPDHASDACFCGREWFTQSTYACKLRCGHFICFDCLTQLVDFAGRGNLGPGEQDPDTKFFRCAMCRDINAVTVDRADIVHSDELDFWRFQICKRFLEIEVNDNWLVRLDCLIWANWMPDWPRDSNGNDRLDHNKKKEYAATRVHYLEARMVMDAAIFVWGLVRYGFTVDNPVRMREGIELVETLKRELQRLAKDGKRYKLAELRKHMEIVGKRAVMPVLVSENKDERLGNPKYPPGFKDFRTFICEWTARACFYTELGSRELIEFMQKMKNTTSTKDIWWRDDRRVFFDP